MRREGTVAWWSFGVTLAARNRRGMKCLSAVVDQRYCLITAGEMVLQHRADVPALQVIVDMAIVGTGHSRSSGEGSPGALGTADAALGVNRSRVHR